MKYCWLERQKPQRGCRTDLAEGLVGVPAEHVCAGGHLLLADEEALVVALVPLPRQPALQQEEESVRERLEVVAAGRCAPEVRVYAGVAHSSTEDIRALVVLDVCAADKVLPPSGCMTTHRVQLGRHGVRGALLE